MHPDNIVHVVNGGFLLHKVIWQKNETLEEMINKYLRYEKKHYAASSLITFDGYPSCCQTASAATSTKRLQSQGFFCKQVVEDADADIIKTSI